MAVRYFCAAVCATLLTLPVASGWAQSDGKMVDNSINDPVVARVNGAEIYRSDLLEAQRTLPNQYRSIPLSKIYAEMVKQMISTFLLGQAGREAGLDMGEAVKRRIKLMEIQIMGDAYIGQIVGTKVTEDALRARYEKTSKAASGGEEIRARHILVKTKAEADLIIKKIANGADFEELAHKESTGPSEAAGGDLGYFARGAMVPPFSDAAFALKVGEVTQRPVQTQFGWHVIKLEDRRKKAGPSFVDSRDKIRAEMIEEILQEAIESLLPKAKIERFNLDGSPISASYIKRVP